MAEAFLFDDCTPVFQPNKNINDIWSRWKEQYSLEVQSFIPQITKSENITRKNRWPHGLRTPFANWFAPKTDYFSVPVPLDYPNTGNYTALPEIKLLMQSKWQRHNTFTG